MLHAVRITLASTLAAATVALAAPVASAATPACGSTLTTDTALTADVTCPTGDGFTLTDGVTLNLGGHVLRGNSEGTAITPSLIGSSTIINGTITGWHVSVSGPTDIGGNVVRLDHVRVVGGGVGEWTTLNITHSRFEHSGVALFRAFPASTITDSVFVDGGVGTTESPVVITRSTFIRSGIGSEEGDVSLDHVTMTGDGRPGAAIGVYYGGLDVRSSSISGFDTGLSLTQSGLTLIDSTIGRNKIGLQATPLVLDGNATIERNNFVANGTAMDLADKAVVRNNVLTGNGQGIVAGPGEQSHENLPRLIEHNTVAFTRGTGILATEPNIIVKDNVVFGGLGQAIVATGATDGGGNRAFLNRGRPQCVGARCLPR